MVIGLYIVPIYTTDLKKLNFKGVYDTKMERQENVIHKIIFSVFARGFQVEGLRECKTNEIPRIRLCQSDISTT